MDKYIWITRPQPQADEMAAELKQRGTACMVSPAITLRQTQNAAVQCSTLNPAIPMIITSQMALHILAQHNHERSGTLMLTGQALKAIALDYGFTNVIVAQGDAQSIVPLLSHPHYYYLHGNHTAFNMAGALAARGINVTAVEIYQSEYAPSLNDDIISALKAEKIAAITCYSSYTASALHHLLSAHHLLNDAKHLPIYCISQAIRTHLQRLGFQDVVVCSVKEMMRCLARRAKL